MSSSRLGLICPGRRSCSLRHSHRRKVCPLPQTGYLKHASRIGGTYPLRSRLVQLYLHARGDVRHLYEDEVYVDAVEEQSIIAMRPEPAFMLLFAVTTTPTGWGKC